MAERVAEVVAVQTEAEGAVTASSTEKEAQDKAIYKISY